MESKCPKCGSPKECDVIGGVNFVCGTFASEEDGIFFDEINDACYERRLAALTAENEKLKDVERAARQLWREFGWHQADPNNQAPTASSWMALCDALAALPQQESSDAPQPATTIQFDRRPEKFNSDAAERAGGGA